MKEPGISTHFSLWYKGIESNMDVYFCQKKENHLASHLGLPVYFDPTARDKPSPRWSSSNSVFADSFRFLSHIYKNNHLKIVPKWITPIIFLSANRLSNGVNKNWSEASWRLDLVPGCCVGLHWMLRGATCSKTSFIDVTHFKKSTVHHCEPSVPKQVFIVFHIYLKMRKSSHQ